MHLVTYLFNGVTYIPISTITHALQKFVSLNSGTIPNILRYYPVVLVCKLMKFHQSTQFLLGFTIFQELDLCKVFEVHKIKIKHVEAN